MRPVFRPEVAAGLDEAADWYEAPIQGDTADQREVSPVSKLSSSSSLTPPR